MERTYKPRLCPCGARFQPEGPRHTYCDDCRWLSPVQRDVRMDARRMSAPAPRPAPVLQVRDVPRVSEGPLPRHKVSRPTPAAAPLPRSFARFGVGYSEDEIRFLESGMLLLQATVEEYERLADRLMPGEQERRLFREAVRERLKRLTDDADRERRGLPPRDTFLPTPHAYQEARRA